MAIGQTGDRIEVPLDPRWTDSSGGKLWQLISNSSSFSSMNSSDCSMRKLFAAPKKLSSTR